MHWQDWVITIGQIIFIVSLIPTLKGKDKPPVSTSVPTGIVLLVFGITQYSLGLVASTFTSAILGTLWIAVGVQKYFLDKK